jgi:probable F420-dependent oxidoreductase
VTLTGIGIWSIELRFSGDEEITEAVAELEELRCSAVWIPDAGGDVLGALERLLRSTSTMTVATGVLNVWRHDPGEIAKGLASWPEEWRRRYLMGLGVSHASLIGDEFAQPMQKMTAYLDALDQQGVGAERRCLGALHPKMLQLARDRSAGAHPFLGTPEHTARAREVLGAGKLLAPEQGFIWETDAGRAREFGREVLARYAALPNYARNWRRIGFSDEDVSSLSDRLVDEVLAWGDVDAIADRVQAHRDAGGDHVCVQVLQPRGAPMPRAAWREVVTALAG